MADEAWKSFGEVVDNGWRDIRDAPRDGTVVLLYIPSLHQHVWVGSFHTTQHLDNGKVSYNSQGWRIGGFAGFGDPPEPTHWMPLPGDPSG